MYRKLPLLATTFVIFIMLQACKVPKSIETRNLAPVSISYIDSLKYAELAEKEIFIPKTTFRLDHNGHLRTLKSEIFNIIDSLTIIELSMPIGAKVARVQFEKDSIFFFDYQDKKGYTFDYLYLSSAIGLPINYQGIEKMLCGYHDHKYFKFSFDNETSEVFKSPKITQAILSISQDDCFAKSVHFTYQHVNELLNYYTIYTDENDYLLSISYKWGENKNSILPERVQIDFNYFDHILGFDYDIKSYETKILQTFELRDTSINMTVLGNEIQNI